MSEDLIRCGIRDWTGDGLSKAISYSLAKTGRRMALSSCG